MLSVFLVIYFFVLLSTFLPLQIKSGKSLLYMVLAILMFLFVIFRGDDTDRDYSLYYFAFYNEVGRENLEQTFTIIVNFIRYLRLGDFWLFFVYAILGMTLKLIAINKLTKYVFVSLLIYISNTYILQDLTQIRAGVCSGLLLISMIPLYHRKFLWFLLCYILAVSFHYSGIPMILIYLMDSKKINAKFWMLLIPLSYLFLLLGITPLGLSKLFNFEIIQYKLENYFNENKKNIAEKVNVFNTIIIIRILFTYFILYNIKRIYENNKYAIVLVKMYIISIILFILLSDVTALAMRFNELFGVVEMIIIPLIIYALPKKNIDYLIVKCIIILYAIILLFFNYRAETLLIFKYD